MASPAAVIRQPSDTVTEADKLHLVQQVASEMARKLGIEDPAELWGAGWLGMAAAEVGFKHHKGRLLAYARVTIRGYILHSQRNRPLPVAEKHSVW